MKHSTLSCFGLFFLYCLVSCSCTENKQQAQLASSTIDKSNTSPINGAWELVWEDIGGKVRSTGKPSQIKLFTNGYFSYLMQDSSGKCNDAGAGTFEVNGNSYKETHLYNTEPQYVGAQDWQEFEMQGDTLVFKLFSKVILANGQDATNQFPKTIEKRVRAGNNIHL